MKISYNVYNMYIRNLRNDPRSIFTEKKRERQKQGRGNYSCHFSDQYFLPCFYVNIQPCCSKTRMEYFNIKIRLLFIENWSG